MEAQKMKDSQRNPEEKEYWGKYYISDFKLYCRVMEIKTTRYWHKTS